MFQPDSSQDHGVLNNYSITVKGQSSIDPEIYHTIDLFLFEEPDTETSYEIILPVYPAINSISYDEGSENSVSYDIYINSTFIATENIDSNIILSISQEPSNVIFEFTPSVIEPTSSSLNSKLKITISKDTPTGNHTIKITAKTDDSGYTDTQSFNLIVNEPASENDDDEFAMGLIFPIILIIIIILIIVVFVIGNKIKDIDNEKRK
jgi:hypothetical protein